MPCYHPLKAYARDRGDGKKELAFVDSYDRITYEKDGKLFYEKIDIPCGQCIGCRLEYSRQWAIRCVLEAKQWKNNYFLTLTYDDEHLFPRSQTNVMVNEETGEYLGDFDSFPLIPGDLTKFIKDLRRQLEYHYNWQGVRFFACGEYGDTTGRPHFHIILFNMPVLTDLVPYKKNFDGSILYNSSFIDKIWKKGYSVIAEVNYNTCAYVARYVMKKKKGKAKEFYTDNGLYPEFSRCSRRPGIARSYYDAEKSHIYEFDELVVTDGKGQVHRVKPPKYYDRLYDIDSPDDLKALKEKRSLSSIKSMQKQLKNTSLSQEDYLSLKEGNKLAQIKNLTRVI